MNANQQNKTVEKLEVMKSLQLNKRQKKRDYEQGLLKGLMA